MFSVISTGTCWRPLCTAMVRPTISGTTVERRDQVLIGLRSFLAEATCTFLARCRSTNGPFFNERGMWRSQSADAVLAALDDHVVGALVVTGLQSLGVLAPRRHRVRVALAGLALAATVRVIDRVHGQPAHRRAYALPALGAGPHFIARLHALGREDVAPFAVGVADERDVAGAVRIVLHALHHPGDAVLVALEVDDAVLLPRATAVVARGDAAEVVARAGLALRRGQWQVRSALVQVRAVDLHHRARAGRSGLVLDEGHMRGPVRPWRGLRSRSSAR